MSQISFQNSSGKVVFQIFAEIEMMQNKNWLIAHHFAIAVCGVKVLS